MQGGYLKIMNRLQEKYQQEIKPKLQEEFKVKNVMSLPKLTKVVINIGAGEAKDNQGILDKVLADLTALAGQKPVVTKAKSSISTFKLGKGQSIGAMVTLRGVRMYQFLDKLIAVAIPKIRDFRGVSPDSFDAQGNYTLGLRELAIFPEVVFTSANSGAKIRGLEATIVTSAKTKEQGKRLLELLGMPFRKGGN